MTDVKNLVPDVGPGPLIAGTVLASAAGIAVSEAFKLPKIASAPGNMVRQDHGRCHVSRRHGDGPTVVFESGLATPLTTWGWVAGHMSTDTPFFSYDRPGVGWSSPAPASWRETYPFGVNDLMRWTGVRPPLILVAHSVGALLTRIYAHEHPELIGGLVFVDPSPPNQFQRGDTARALDHLRGELNRLQLRSMLRLPMPHAWTHPMQLLPEPLSVRSVQAIGRYSALRAARQEVDMSASGWAERAAGMTTTNVPVAVVASGAVLRGDPEYQQAIDEIAGMSSINRTVVIDDADHLSILCDRTHARDVARAIEWVIDRCPRSLIENTTVAAAEVAS